MLQNNEATTLSDQDTSNDSVVQLAASELATNPSTNDAVVFVTDGAWEDPRQTFTGQFVEDHGEKMNAVPKLQRSITVLLADGTKLLVSAFGEKTCFLKSLKLGGTYTFKGKLNVKTGKFQGKERVSRFLNL
jgi:hypothetical protein